MSQQQQQEKKLPVDTGKGNVGDFSFAAKAWRGFHRDILAMTGLAGVVFMCVAALLTPLLANNRPFLILAHGGGISFPFLRYLFAPDSTETFIEQVFNYTLLLLPPAALIFFFCRKHKRIRNILLLISATVLLIPFFLTGSRLDKSNWREITAANEDFAVFAPIPYGPYEAVTAPYAKPSSRHLFGGDQNGRDVLVRMLYGARVSLAVGLLATSLALVIGTLVGMFAGYYCGVFDLLTMRIVEIIMCFPTFLLLLILMSMLKDQGFGQSILLVIMVLGLTGWIGLCRLVRGEVLKQRVLPYITSCEATGLPVFKIMMRHLLPNVSGPIFISFTFGIAGAIIAESGLSFLGFGVQAPTASWGALLRQAFADPLEYWHLTLWPGTALFITVCAFNFTGEGLRKIFDPKVAD
ncbi:MAG: ABC transporter permease [Victivallales bacterium]|nr:ABC transporter permease [Victivallales bacterium]